MMLAALSTLNAVLAVLNATAGNPWSAAITAFAFGFSLATVLWGRK
jgi:hypothetical protein